VTKRLEEELAKRDALIEVPDTLCDSFITMYYFFAEMHANVWFCAYVVNKKYRHSLGV
jgi:hypothetical protein